MRVTGKVQSFFKNEHDYSEAVRLLTEFMDGREYGCVSQASSYLAANIPYANRNHLVEIVMRDRRFMLKGEGELRIRVTTYVTPPDTLWFGTVVNMAKKFGKNGARSVTKGYVKLHDNEAAALIHARKFIRGPEACFAIEVDAKSMQDIDKFTFSTYEEGEYCVREIPANRFKRGKDSKLCGKLEASY